MLSYISQKEKHGPFDLLLHEPRQRRSWLIFDVGQSKAMRSLESAIKSGPFQTDHHRAIVDQRFRESFLEFVRSEVVPKVEGSPLSVTGRLFSHYDEERFFGPRSLVKYRYAFELTFRSEAGEEKARGEFDYDPITSAIRTARFPVYVDSLSEQKKRARMMECAADIAERYRSGERHFVCPECGRPLHVWFFEPKKMIKDISCPEGCIRMHFD